jgi:predicted nucleic-acid-binding protein
MKYIADSSFIIGLFVDEPRTSVAKETYTRLNRKKEKVYIPEQAMIEVIYVLEKFYKFKREKVSEYIQAILNTYIFIIEKYEIFYEVMDLYVKYPRINLGDIIIAVEGKRKGIKKVLSFDKYFKELGFEVVNL